MSATYQQASVSTTATRGERPAQPATGALPALRMPAELVSDNTLAASGLLVRGRRAERLPVSTVRDLEIGQQETLYPESTGGCRRIATTAAACIRSSSATRRIPAMAVFDLPDGGGPSVRQYVSNTPLQALVLLNDPQYVEAYRALATHVLEDGGRLCGADQGAGVPPCDAPPAARRGAAMLQDFFAEERMALYRADLVAARALTAIAASHHAGRDRRTASQLAAFTRVVAVIMNSPDAYTSAMQIKEDDRTRFKRWHESDVSTRLTRNGVRFCSAWEPVSGLPDASGLVRGHVERPVAGPRCSPIRGLPGRAASSSRARSGSSTFT